jgi:hypothetical protein
MPKAPFNGGEEDAQEAMDLAEQALTWAGKIISRV